MIHIRDTFEVYNFYLNFNVVMLYIFTPSSKLFCLCCTKLKKNKYMYCDANLLISIVKRNHFIISMHDLPKIRKKKERTVKMMMKTMM